MCPILIRVGGVSPPGAIPVFSYTGAGASCLLTDETVNGVPHWKIKFFTSGTLTFTSLGSLNLDVFCVGGGGKANVYTSSPASGFGGGGGTTALSVTTVALNTPYNIVVGAGATTDGKAVRGGTSSAFGVSAIGGQGGAPYDSGDGGSGGSDRQYAGGTNGSNGTGVYTLGYGQGSTTREFGEASGYMYSNGGCGSGYAGYATPPRANSGDGSNARPSGTIDNGAAGTVVIRDHRAV